MANGRRSGIRADGQRCQGVPIAGSTLCPAHHPDTQHARRRGSKKGGRRGGKSRPNALIADLRDQLLEIVDQVRDDELPADKAAVMGRLIRYAIQSVADELDARERLELIPRIEELERLLDPGREQQRWGTP